MSRKSTSKRARPKPKAVLRLPDLDQAKTAVLNGLTSADAQRGYRHAIDESVDWYGSEPRLSFNAVLSFPLPTAFDAECFFDRFNVFELQCPHREMMKANSAGL